MDGDGSLSAQNLPGSTARPNKVTTRSFLQTIWLVRTPILSLATLYGLGALAEGRYNSVLVGLFNLEGDSAGMLLVATIAFLTAATCLTTINMVLHLGTARFNVPGLAGPSPGVQLAIFLIANVPPILFFGNVCRLTPGSHIQHYAIGVAGFGLAAVLVFLAKLIQMKWTDPSRTKHPPPYLVFPASVIPPMDALLLGFYNTPIHKSRTVSRAKKWLNDHLQWLFGIIAASGEGYFIPTAPGLVLESAQTFTIALTALSFSLYFVLGLFGPRGYWPSLFYVLLAQLVFTWILGGLCFFLDRFRFPVLVAAFLLTLLTSNAPEADHYFKANRLDGQPAWASPRQVIDVYKGGKAPILVAAAGGGIQAAAWTTTVLAGLHEQCPECDIPNRLMLFSGVSGGSVGAMDIGATWPNLQKARTLARKPSLDAIAWGWVNPDIWRALSPWFRPALVDRGRSLEESWENRAGEPLRKASLSAWGADVLGKKRPVFLFNATRVESGAPVIFSTTQFPSGQSKLLSRPHQAISFHDLYKGLDLAVTTAVRMSATFPYVSPAARPYTSDPQLDPADQMTMARGAFHLVDGGYYDNYGIYTLLTWLESALTPDPAVHHLVILRLMAFPPEPDKLPSLRGWGYQMQAPFDAFLATRSTAQLAESDAVLRRFTAHWQNLQPEPVDILSAVLEYPSMDTNICEHPALSWKLTSAQQQCLDDAWKHVQSGPNVQILLQYLRTH